MEQRARIKCALCAKTFYDSSGRNKHLRRVHGAQKPTLNRKLSCPLCHEEKVSFDSFRSLRDHFREVHGIKICEHHLTFTNKSEFESWMYIDNKDGSYCKVHTSGSRIDYVCNRNNMRGYQGTCTQRQRQLKAGGSIKIDGSCPSQIIVNFVKDKVQVYYCETHVGHQIELRNHHLNKEDQLKIIEKLKLGVTAESIIKDSRIIKGDKLERINLLNKTDIRNIRYKANIADIRHTDDLLAVVKTEACDEFSVPETLNDVGNFKVSEVSNDQVLLQEVEDVDAALELKRGIVMAKLKTLNSETEHAMLDKILTLLDELDSKPIQKNRTLDEHSYSAPSKEKNT